MRALVVAALIAAPALAQTSPSGARTQLVREIVIDSPEAIDGQLQGPDAEVVSSPRRPDQPSLLRERDSFGDQVLDSFSEL